MTTDQEIKSILGDIRAILSAILVIVVLGGVVFIGGALYRMMATAAAAGGPMAVNIQEIDGKPIGSPYTTPLPVVVKK